MSIVIIVILLVICTISISVVGGIAYYYSTLEEETISTVAPSSTNTLVQVPTPSSSTLVTTPAPVPTPSVSPTTMEPAPNPLNFAKYICKSDVISGVCKKTMMSDNENYRAVAQIDGNFVIYGPESVVWESGTRGDGSGDLKITDTGKLVFTNIWESATTSSNNFAPYAAGMTNDGNLIIKDKDGLIVWNSKDHPYRG